MTKKFITGIIFLTFAFLCRAQETLIVRGFLKESDSWISFNFQRNMFCYFNGDFIMPPAYGDFCTFSVDSVISGSFLNFNNEINKTPFNIKVFLINEATVLDYNQEYTLRIKQFPNMNYYYIDSLHQVIPNEKYAEKLTKYYKDYQHNINVLTKGTLQERHNFLDSIRKNYYDKDYRYIAYLIPFMTCKDSIINYITTIFDGRDAKTGVMCCSRTEISEEKELYSRFLYNYLEETLPFALPRKTTDSIGWHKWYDGLLSKKECFPFVKYAQTEDRTIAKKINPFYFILDTSSQTIYFAGGKAYALNVHTDELTEKPLPRNCNEPVTIYSNYSIQNNEIIEYNSYEKGIVLSKLDNGTFCRNNNKIIPLNLLYKPACCPGNYTYPNLIIHSGKDFFVFTSQNPDGYNYLKAGKINRKGKWMIDPKNLYKNPSQSSVGSVNYISAFSFCSSGKNETTFAFVNDTIRETINRLLGSSYLKTFETITEIIVYKLNEKLEVKDSIILPSNYDFTDTYLLKNAGAYLLLAMNRNQLFYRILNNDLTPKTDFIQLANNKKEYLSWGKPITTSEGFMISWVDNDLSENVLRSVLIDTSGKQSNIINITNQKTDGIYNIEPDPNHVDIYLFNNDENTLIRKRIDKKEYGL